MATPTIIRSFSSFDTKTIILPGLYLSFVIATTLSPYVQLKPETDFINLLKLVVVAMQENPGWLLILLFSSFLLGNVVYAISHRFLDWIPSTSFFSSIPYHLIRRWPFLHKRFPKIKTPTDKPWEKFPYPTKIAAILKNLAECNGKGGIIKSRLPFVPELPPEDNSVDSKVKKKLLLNLWRDLFNHWKDRIAICSENGFQYYQTFEARVRFFGGMTWVGLCGILGSSILGYSIHWSGSLWAVLLFTSLVILLVFGLFGYKRVRVTEVEALFTIYTAYLQQLEKPIRPRPRPSNTQSPSA